MIAQDAFRMKNVVGKLTTNAGEKIRRSQFHDEHAGCSIDSADKSAYTTEFLDAL
jgi:hypothetical protein